MLVKRPSSSARVETATTRRESSDSNDTVRATLRMNCLRRGLALRDQARGQLLCAEEQSYRTCEKSMMRVSRDASAGGTIESSWVIQAGEISFLGENLVASMKIS